MQDHITIEALYPRARKLQFELKIQLSYLESQTGSSGETLQTEARQNLTLLQQLLWQLESMIQVHTPEERPPWLQKLHQLKQETESLGATLEQHIFRHNRLAVQLNERESLLNRRHTSFMDGNIARYATQESESLHRSSTMVSDLTSLSHSILGDLTDQRHRLKSVHTKVIDIANRLGLSNSVLRVIERRDAVDFWIVMAGMVITLITLYCCYVYASSKI